MVPLLKLKPAVRSLYHSPLLNDHDIDNSISALQSCVDPTGSLWMPVYLAVLNPLLMLIKYMKVLPLFLQFFVRIE